MVITIFHFYCSIFSRVARAVSRIEGHDEELVPFLRLVSLHLHRKNTNMLSYLVHFISGKTIGLEFFVLYCHFICGIRSIVILHTKDAPLHQVEEVVFVFRFSSTTSVFFLQFLKLVMRCNFVDVLAGFFVCSAA